jgi:hypothetical protein
MLVYVTNCWVGGWVGRGGKLSFRKIPENKILTYIQCLRPSASLRAAGKNVFRFVKKSRKMVERKK